MINDNSDNVYVKFKNKFIKAKTAQPILNRIFLKNLYKDVKTLDKINKLC